MCQDGISPFPCTEVFSIHIVGSFVQDKAGRHSQNYLSAGGQEIVSIGTRLLSDEMCGGVGVLLNAVGVGIVFDKIIRHDDHEERVAMRVECGFHWGSVTTNCKMQFLMSRNSCIFLPERLSAEEARLAHNQQVI